MYCLVQRRKTQELATVGLNSLCIVFQVIVEGIGDITDKRLKFYFNNKKRGGNIKDVESANRSKVIITFENQKGKKASLTTVQ